MAPGRRRLAVALAFGTACAAATVALAEDATGDVGTWPVAVLAAVVTAAPLVVLGLAVRAGDPRTAWLTLALATALTGFVLLALVGGWSGRSVPEQVLDAAVAALVVATCAATWLAEAPLLRTPAR